MCAMSIPGTALHDLRYVHERPPGQAILQQRWSDLAFLHWPVEPHAVQRLLPRGLDLETFDGAAWIGATPFRVSRMRPALFPALPWVGDGLELNLRTYVRAGDAPGVWFFSLDATNPLAVLSARVGFHLPYFFASIDLERKGATRHFHARRTHPGVAEATFDAEWTLEERLPAAAPGSLDFFLVERYWLYAADAGRLWRARIHHERWPLRRARAKRFEATLFAAHGLPAMAEPPIVHALREPLHVEIWPLRRVPQSEPASRDAA